MSDSKPTEAGARQPDLDALRAMAALCVFASHLPWFAYFGRPSTAGWLGQLTGRAPIWGLGGFAVCIFIVISGVGLTRLLALKGPGWWDFVMSRLTPLFTTYWAVAVPVILIALLAGALAAADLWKAILWLLGLGLVHPGSFAPLIGSWWYIGLAWQLVLVMPLVVWGLRTVGVWVVLGTALAIALASCFVISPLGIGYAEKSLVVTRIVELVGGALLACSLWPEVAEALGVTQRTATYALVAASASLLVFYGAGLGGRWLYRGSAVALVGVVVAVRAVQRSGSERLARFAVWAGAVSFAFYLVHEAVIKGVWAVAGNQAGLPFAVGTIVALVAAVLLGVLFTRGAAALRRRGAASGS